MYYKKKKILTLFLGIWASHFLEKNVKPMNVYLSVPGFKCHSHSQMK